MGVREGTPVARDRSHPANRGVVPCVLGLSEEDNRRHARSRGFPPRNVPEPDLRQQQVAAALALPSRPRVVRHTQQHQQGKLVCGLRESPGAHDRGHARNRENPRRTSPQHFLHEQPRAAPLGVPGGASVVDVSREREIRSHLVSDLREESAFRPHSTASARRTIWGRFPLGNVKGRSFTDGMALSRGACLLDDGCSRPKGPLVPYVPDGANRQRSTQSRRPRPATAATA